MTCARYILTARLGDERGRKRIYADSSILGEAFGDEQERLDFDATTAAIQRIMDLATNHPLWAQGEIVLTREDGTVIHRMEAKTTEENA